MSPDEIKHFLVVYRVSEGTSKVQEFGTDYDAAQAAYAAAEQEHRADDDTDIVLLGADSLATIKETHSSYFKDRDALKRELLSA
jgi:hypothetical protein